jgi:hypothetical protein
LRLARAATLSGMADRPRAISKPHTFSLVAAAEVITSRGVRVKTPADSRMLDWQERAWDYFDTVGEFRFGVSWLSNTMSRVNLVAASAPKSVGDEPTAINLEVAEDAPPEEQPTGVQRRATELVAMIAGGASGQGQLLGEFGQHLPVAGFGWLVVEPDLEDPQADTYETWQVYSQDGVKIDKDDVSIRRAASGNEQWRKAHPNALIVKAWRKHPRRPWEPDAQIRASLAILDQLDLLSAHITATGRSRLAGAGMLAIPSEATFPQPPPKEGDDDPSDDPQDAFDSFVEQLVDTMTVPIKDRDSAAGVVPLVIQIPGEFIDKLKHLTFATPFDSQVIALIQEAVKRLALGMDMPPEVLTGMAGVNHWTAWQVEETAITLHVEPMAEIVCQSLTLGYLKAALEAEQFSPEEVGSVMVWYDTSDLTAPADKSGNVVMAYDRFQASGKALRRELGLVEDDAPDDDEFKRRILLDVAKLSPDLVGPMLTRVGILEEEIAAATSAIESGARPPISAPAEPAADVPAVDGPPDRQASAALLMACDGIVYRAMERAGNRLKSAIGRSLEGGPQAVTAIAITALHTKYDPTIYADLDMLLAGSMERVPFIAKQFGLEPDVLEQTMVAYCRALLAAGHEHDLTRLAAAVG